MLWVKLKVAVRMSKLHIFDQGRTGVNGNYDSFLREDMLDPATAFLTVAVSLLFSHGRQATLHLDTLN